MKKFASLVLALALCLSLAAPALAAEERTVRAMTPEEALQYVDFGPNTPIEKPADVLIEKEFRIDQGSLGSTTTKIGYYAIRKDAVFKLGNLGTPGGGSFLVMYLTPYVNKGDGVYHVSGQYYLRGGSQSGWALNDNPTRADEVRVTTGNNVSTGIPAEHLPEDTLYCFTIMAYLSNEIICEDLFFKVDEAKVAEVIRNDSRQANSAPTSVDAFTDVAAASPFRAAIDWAVKQGITKGATATTFGPSNTCTTSHILTFLYRAAGSPVKDSNEHAGMTWWAKERGIDTSNLNAPCTRAAAVTYIWKAAGSPKPTKTASFSDVPSSTDYAQAVSWAVQVGITNGTSGTTFSPNQTCTRGQIVTFLYRAMVAVNASTTPDTSSTPAAGTKEEQLAAKVVELVNQERAKEGLPPLQTLPAITAAAQVRVQELAIDRSHTRPNGKDGTTAMDDKGVISTMSGENLAFGFTTAEGPMNWWMDSPIHRMNILMPGYTHTGVAYLNGNWVQLFARVPESGSSGTSPAGASVPGSSPSSTTGTVTWRGYTFTALPADGLTDYFRQEWGDGQYLEIQIVDGLTFQLSGCVQMTDSQRQQGCRAYVAGLGAENSVPVTSGVPFTVSLSLEGLEFRGNAGASAGVFSKWDSELDGKRQSVAQIMTRVHAFAKDGNGGYLLHIEYMS